MTSIILFDGFLFDLYARKSVYYIVYLFLNLNLLSFHIITSIDHFLWIMMATNTTKDLIIGRIYEIHQSIRNAFNLESNEQTANYSSTNSSVTTASSESASSARKKKLRPFTRSCLLWGQNQDHCIVLFITTFNDTDHRWNRSTFLRTGAGIGLNKSDRTGPAGLPVWPVER